MSNNGKNITLIPAKHQVLNPVGGISINQTGWPRQIWKCNKNLNPVGGISTNQTQTVTSVKPCILPQNFYITFMRFLKGKNYFDALPDLQAMGKIFTTVIIPLNKELERLNISFLQIPLSLKYYVALSTIEKLDNIQKYIGAEQEEQKKEIKQKNENLLSIQKTVLEKAEKTYEDCTDEAIKKCAVVNISVDPNKFNTKIFEKAPSRKNLPQTVKENKFLDLLMLFIFGGIIAICLTEVFPFISLSPEAIYEPLLYVFYLAGIGITLALSITADRGTRLVYSRIIDGSNSNRHDYIVGFTNIFFFSILLISEVTLESYALYKAIQDAILDNHRIDIEAGLSNIPLVMIILVGFVMSNAYVFKKISTAMYDCDKTVEFKKELNGQKMIEAREGVMKTIYAKKKLEESKKELEQVNKKLLPYKEELDRGKVNVVEMARFEAHEAWKDFCKEVDVIEEHLYSMNHSMQSRPKPGLITGIKIFIKDFWSRLKNLIK